MSIFRTIVFSALIAAAGAAPAADYYVAPDGSDDDPGTKNEPFKTLAAARDAARKIKDKSVTVYLDGGYHLLTETLTLDLRDSRKPDAPLTFTAREGRRAIVGAGVPVTGWRKVERYPRHLPKVACGKVWVAEIPPGVDEFFTMYDGEKHLPRSRSAPALPRDKFEDTDRIHDKTLLRYPDGLIRDWKNIRDIEIRIIPANPWLINILKLARVNEANNTCHTVIPATYGMRQCIWWMDLNPNLWVENAIDYLDAPGQWCVNTRTGKIWYWPASGEPGDGIRVPALGVLVKVAGETNTAPNSTDTPVKGINFRDLTFMHAGRGLWKKGDAGIQHDWEMVDKDNALVRFDGAENCRVVNCEFTASGGNAVRMDYHCRGIEIVGNEINNLGQSAVVCIGYGPGTKDVNNHNLIADNHIHHCGLIYWHSQMIILWQSGHNYVANNFIHDVPRKAVLLGGPRKGYFRRKSDRREVARTFRWEELAPHIGDGTRDFSKVLKFLHTRNNVVENNEVRNALGMLGDGACINVTGCGSGNVIRHNLVYDLKNKRVSAALRADGWQGRTIFEDNIVYRCRKSAMSVKGEEVIRNNYFISLGDTDGHIRVFPKRYPPGESVWWGNIFYTHVPAGRFYGRMSPEHAGLFEDCTIDANVYFARGGDSKKSEFLAALRRAGNDQNSIYADPKFNDPANWGFTLADDSPALAAGVRQLTLDNMGLTSDFPRRFEADEGFRSESRYPAKRAATCDVLSGFRKMSTKNE